MSLSISERKLRKPGANFEWNPRLNDWRVKPAPKSQLLKPLPPPDVDRPLSEKHKNGVKISMLERNLDRTGQGKGTKRTVYNNPTGERKSGLKGILERLKA